MLGASGPLKQLLSNVHKEGIWAKHQGEEDSVLDQDPPSGKDGSFPHLGNCQNIKEYLGKG